jgi:hypothetical protein
LSLFQPKNEEICRFSNRFSLKIATFPTFEGEIAVKSGVQNDKMEHEKENGKIQDLPKF